MTAKKHIIESIKIIGLSIFFSVVYGIIHDIITVQVSLEYFTIGHPKLIESENPIVLAIFWGCISTWWVGLIIGILLAVTSRFGKFPLFSVKYISGKILKLLGIMLLMALISGVTGYLLTEYDVIYLVKRLAKRIPEENHSKFLAVGWAHASSYIIGFIGSLKICREIWKERKESVLQ